MCISGLTLERKPQNKIGKHNGCICTLNSIIYKNICLWLHENTSAKMRDIECILLTYEMNI